MAPLHTSPSTLLFTSCVGMLLLVKGILATEFVVGNQVGWTNYDARGFKVPDYGAWATSQRVMVGDYVVFKYARGRHNVNLLPNRQAYLSCDFSQAQLLDSGETGVYIWRATKAGVYYFGCNKQVEEEGNHCGSGQKLALAVEGRRQLEEVSSLSAAEFAMIAAATPSMAPTASSPMAATPKSSPPMAAPPVLAPVSSPPTAATPATPIASPLATPPASSPPPYSPTPPPSSPPSTPPTSISPPSTTPVATPPASSSPVISPSSPPPTEAPPTPTASASPPPMSSPPPPPPPPPAASPSAAPSASPTSSPLASSSPISAPPPPSFGPSSTSPAGAPSSSPSGAMNSMGTISYAAFIMATAVMVLFFH